MHTEFMPWESFKTLADEAQRTDDTEKAALLRDILLSDIANGPSFANLTYDPFTFRSRIFGPGGRR